MITPAVNPRCQVCGIGFPLTNEETGRKILVASQVAPHFLAKCQVCSIFEIEPVWLIQMAIDTVGKENLKDSFFEIRTIHKGRFMNVKKYMAVTGQ